MPVYINASSMLSAKEKLKQPINFLEQQAKVPYFRYFEQQPLSLESLYSYLEQQIRIVLDKADWNIEELKDIPIFLGSTAYVMADCEKRFINSQSLFDPHTLTHIADYFYQRYQATCFSFATSCTSSAQAIAYATRMLESGIYNKAIVIGFEPFNRFTLDHFYAMNMLSLQDNYLPLISPSGIVLGEGIGTLALSRHQQKNALFDYEIIAVTTITDNDNLTNTDKESFYQLINNCLENAGLSHNQIKGIKTHSVGSPIDELEKEILVNLFPKAFYLVPKLKLGHTLGASGALETAALLQSFQNISWLEDCVMVFNNESLEISREFQLNDGYYLNYFLGFGGSNVAWVLKVTRK